MIIQFHTPSGIVAVDSDTVTDEELSQLNMSRERMLKYVPRDFGKEIEELRAQIHDHEVRLAKDIGGHSR